MLVRSLLRLLFLFRCFFFIIYASSNSTSPLSLFSSDMAAVTSPRISCIGLEVAKMPGLNGWTMCLSANVVTQVYFQCQYTLNHDESERAKTHLNPTDLVLDEIDNKAISNFTSTLLHAFQ